MRPLHRSDPSTIAGFRLLGRLGTGGMGVVYLARSGGGALAAVKRIRAEYAADPGFRERFRREARTAERITGRWVVGVLGADAEAREPWLATEFVPGPSLDEAVSLHGPLPEATVRALGARLADALAGMHDAGLVHRDVKPGNVLLALDGPRLIDFGIARSADATALTATDAVIGTPGFLAPEQAGLAGHGDADPAADVFSLGCVLAFALTGRRPFGTGMAAAVVYRTVHEEADLDGVPVSLLALVTACLAKEAAARPSAAEVRSALGPADGPAGDWLPPGLPALVARRSAEILDLPVAEPTVAVTEEPRGPSRRRLLRLGSAGAVSAAGGLAVWLLSRTPPGADSGRADPLTAYTIGVQTDLSGPRAADGRAQERGARLAVEQFNRRAERPFDLVLKVRDDRGDAGAAAAAARALVAERAVAVLGPTSRETVAAVAGTYHSHRAVLISVATGVEQGDVSEELSDPGYFEMRPLHDTLEVPYVRYLVLRGVARVAVVEDRDAGDYAWRILRARRMHPPNGAAVTGHRIAADSEDFASVVREALATRPDGVLYAGISQRRAALCARALAAQGFAGYRGGVEYALGPLFLAAAGDAAEGWFFGTSYVDPARLDTARRFATDYRARWGLGADAPVDRFAAEAYDAVLAAAEAMRQLAEEHADVAAGGLRRKLRRVSYRGITKTIAFNQGTTAFEGTASLFLWQIRGGVPYFRGHFEEAAKTP